ncbi:MAG: BON domain-containing protein [Thermoguttaceae bacterium]|nr:BON domain-containing protein [Thermoguttaceae bacterium]MBR0191797.1 BON domain-containing protein [Thermoguttaceae bacterium]
MRRVFSFSAILLAVALAPMTVLGSNQEMAEEIAGVLEDANLIEGCDIGLKYENETVWLTGVVDSSEKISAIQAKIEEMDGVASVVNKLEVEKTAVEDASVQQVAIFQNQVMSCPGQLDIEGGQVISDEVVSVDGVPVNAEQADDGANLPSILNVDDSQMSSTSVSAGKPRPIQANYGLTVKPVSYGDTSIEGPTSTTTTGIQSGPVPMNSQAYAMPMNGGSNMRYDEPYMPRKAWPSYASYPNTAAVQYPKRHCASCWPYIGPYYPYPQVPDGWRKVTLEWSDGYWQLDFNDGTKKGPFNGLFRQKP